MNGENFEFEFLSAEEANEIATSHNIKPRDDNYIIACLKLKDNYIGAFLKESVEYEIREAAKEGKKSVDIEEDENLPESDEKNEKIIINYLRSKGYKADIVTKRDSWRRKDYKVFSIKWGDDKR